MTSRGIAYRDTEVPTERSQSHIRDLLYKYGASGIQFTESLFDQKIQMRFAYQVQENGQAKVTYFVRIQAEVPEMPPQDRRTTAAMRKHDQIVRAGWRAIYWALKSRMESIDYGIETFEEAFLAHFEAGVDDKGRSVTIGERVIPRLRAGQLALVEGTSGTK